jgi:hypothetical protein
MKRFLVYSIGLFMVNCNLWGLTLYNDEYHSIDNEIIQEPVYLVGEQFNGYPCDISNSYVSGIHSYGWYKSIIDNSRGIQIQLFEDSISMISNPTFQSMDLYGNAESTITGGEFLGLNTHENSRATVQGLTCKYFVAEHNSTIDIWGVGNNKLHYLEGDGKIILHGIFETEVLSDGSLFITGTYSNGQDTTARYYPYPSGEIIFVPEPATLLLLSIGGLLIRKRK